jgi:hypothetical protein
MVKARQSPQADLRIDDIYVDNGGENRRDPMKDAAACVASHVVSGVLEMRMKPSEKGGIKRVNAPLDATGSTGWFQGMWPTDPLMPSPKFPRFAVEPLSDCSAGMTVARQFPKARYLDECFPVVNFSVNVDGHWGPLYRGAEGSQIAFRTENLLKLVDSAGAVARQIEMMVVTHRRILWRIRLAGEGTCSFRAELSAQDLGGDVTDAGNQPCWSVRNLRGRQAVKLLPGKNSGEVLAVAVYDAVSKEDLESELKEACVQVSEFDKLWSTLAGAHKVESFLIGTETPSERNLIAGMVNRVLRNQRQGGRIRTPSAVEFYGPEWGNADAVWIWFQPACRYALWIEPSFWAQSLRTLLDSQREDGFISQIVSQANASGHTQHPNIAMVARDYYVFTGDREFLKYAYPRLKKWYEWFLETRDKDGARIFVIGDPSYNLRTTIFEYRDNL